MRRRAATRSDSLVAVYVERDGTSSAGLRVEGSSWCMDDGLDDMVSSDVLGMYGFGAAKVENESGDGGGRGRCENPGRKLLGVPRGEGRSGSIRRFALREVRNAALVRKPGIVGINLSVL